MSANGSPVAARFAAAAVAAIIVFGLTGCASLEGSARSIEVDGNAWTIHGVLRMAGSLKPDNLNPLLGTQVVDTDISSFWGAVLFVIDDRSRAVPELALEVPTMKNGGVSKDGLTITYHLRQGVLWQDGAPFTADDVVYTWRQVMNPRNDTGSRQGYELIRAIDEPNYHTVVVHLRQR